MIIRLAPAAVALLFAAGAALAAAPPCPDSLIAPAEIDTLTELELGIFPPDGVLAPYSYQIDWGDGDTLDWTEPMRVSYDVYRTHRYTAWGAFTIRVRLRDSLARVSDWTPPLPVTVGDPPLKWVFPTFDPVVASAALDADGNVYIGDDTGWLYSMDPAGQLRWAFQADDALFSAAAIDGRHVYVGSLDSNLYCLDRATGKQAWKLNVGDEIYAPPAIDAGGRLYLGTDAGHVLAITARPDNPGWLARFLGIAPQGKVAWRYNTGEEITASPTIGPNGRLYISADSLYCLDLEGHRRWTFGAGTQEYFFAAAVPDAEGNVYVGNSDGSIYAIGPDGDQLWSLPVPDEDEIRPEIVFGPDGALWLGTDGYYLCRLDAPGPAGPPPGATARVMYEANDIISGTPAVSDKGTVYFLSDDGTLRALRADGRILWSYEIASEDKDTYYTSSPTIGPDGTVYVGSWDGGLFAFQGDGPPAPGPWSQYRHDARNSGRSE